MVDFNNLEQEGKDKAKGELDKRLGGDNQQDKDQQQSGDQGQQQNQQ